MQLVFETVNSTGLLSTADKIRNFLSDSQAVVDKTVWNIGIYGSSGDGESGESSQFEFFNYYMTSLFLTVSWKIIMMYSKITTMRTKLWNRRV